MNKPDAAARAVRFSRAEGLLLLLVFAFYTVCASLLPTEHCPDEAARMRVVQWICDTHTLPTGDEPETLIPQWGFSYALRPYLASILSAAGMTAASVISRAAWFLRLGARMVSVLSAVACCFYCLRLGHRLFRRRSAAVLLAVFVCFLPQVCFLGSYLNNDILALAAVCMMLYYMAEGCDTAFSWRSCAGLGVSLSIALLSYYSVYGWILFCAVFCVAAALRDRRIAPKARFILGRGAAILGICLALAGWFFIRNAVLHEGDFLGLASETRSRERLAAQGMALHPYNSFAETGYSLAGFIGYRENEWLRMTCQSFVGVFSTMTLYLPRWRYGLYYAVLWLGILMYMAALRRGRLEWRDRLLMRCALAAGAVTLGLSLAASYLRDYEPQGRYVITLALLFGLLLAYGADRLELRAAGEERPLPAASALILLWAVMFAHSFLLTMTQMFA